MNGLHVKHYLLKAIKMHGYRGMADLTFKIKKDL